uniref:Myosin motor domain-containing protein n=1 Tax=Petromyzon marinus TaxID=7757 RepID=S4RUU5_PETMA
GESGSGKTEAAKLILGFLSATPSNSSCPQEHEGPSILEAIPVLEAFGNAKTLRNNNSSRFGKYLQVFVERGVISGSITSEYLLERSRVVYQAANERNYHVFYELLVGLPPQQKQRLGLQDAEMYYYLNQGGVCELPGKSDGRDFQRLGALERLGLSLEERGALFRILAAILHLGNIYFARAEMDRQEVACVASGPEMRITADLLQVSFQKLQMSITYKLTETMREKIFSPLSVEASVKARDTLAKVLYTQLFAWIIARLNAKGASTQQGVTLAILDIYGFEDLGVNSFEQLCINYANECLQSFINKIIFKQEQEEYVRDRLSWKEVPFCDNQPCLALIAQKPHGILHILDDQTAFPQASDHSFLQKCHYHHGGNELYSKPKIPLPEFTIKHYAGRVTYQVSHFVEKNREHVRQDVMDLFLGSSCTLLAEIFQTRRHLAAAVPGPRGGPLGHTVSSAFQHSLQELLSRMEQCNTCLIRCLKPNSRKEAGSFEPELVRNQLRYLGILETIRIRKAGFPVRMPFDSFIRRWKCIRYAVLTESTGKGKNGCLSILNILKPEPEGLFRIGLSQVFMKEALYVRLDRERER